MPTSSCQIINHTWRWLQEIVIELGLCPFAALPFKQNKIHYQVCAWHDSEACLHSFAGLLDTMDRTPQIETALLILDEQSTSDTSDRFSRYLDLLELMQALLEDCGYTGIYQLASFHPDYCFQGTRADDVSNFTNRSPYPMIHILREESISHAIQNFRGDIAQIPDKNILTMQKHGFTSMHKKWLSIFHLEDSS